jgi:hypothetical protein
MSKASSSRHVYNGRGNRTNVAVEECFVALRTFIQILLDEMK